MNDQKDMDTSLTAPKYQRVLLKLSGEALMGEAAFGISTKVLDYLATEIQTLVDLKVETSLVIGAGNIFRGPQHHHAQDSGTRPGRRQGRSRGDLNVPLQV